MVRLSPVALIVALVLASGALLEPPEVDVAQAANLVADPGFEQGGAGWQTCGGVRLADAQATNSPFPVRVHSGRYAARLGNPTINSGNDACPPPSHQYAPRQLLRAPVTIPAGAPGLTVSFWYYLSGTASINNVDVFLCHKVDYISADAGCTHLDVLHEEGVGWHLFRQVLNAERFAQVRGRSTYLNIRLTNQLTAAQSINLFIDDVVVTPSVVRTTPAPLPPALQGDGSQPIVYWGINPQTGKLAIKRMDTDGTDQIVIYRGRFADVFKPRWSPDGASIAVLETDLNRQDFDRPNNNPAFETELAVLDTTGTYLSTAGRTLGRSGIQGLPAGCVPGAQVCARPEVDALDVQITDAVWSPDGQGFVVEVGYRSRNSVGQTGDTIAQLLLVNQTTRPTILPNDEARLVASAAVEPSWSATNRIAFRHQEGYTGVQRTSGIYLDTPEVRAGNEQLFTANAALSIPRGDQHPVWAPDGERFVTVRKIAGGETFFHNPSIVLHEARGNRYSRTILVQEYPSQIIGKPTWSPDGKYLLYTLYTRGANPNGTNEAYNIWWLDVESGATGPLTTDGLSSQPDWRPVCQGACAGSGPGSPRSYLPLVQH
jgi:hypothetical protein